jgi:DNA-binding NarL/FixJ family response regulator
MLFRKSTFTMIQVSWSAGNYMNNEFRIFLLCENRLLREALLRILVKRTDLSMVGACGYSSSALSEVVASNPRVVILDSLRLALEPPIPLRQIHQSVPGVRTVMIGMESRESDFLSAVREGVAGYILREASAEEVLKALQAVINGESVCPSCFVGALFQRAGQQLASQENLKIRNGAELSRREQQLLDLICTGLTNKEIAGRLNLSEHTVKNHVHRILRKTGFTDRLQLIEIYGSRRLSNDPLSMSAIA